MKVITFFVDIGYLVKLLSNHKTTLSHKNLENISNFEGWDLILVAKKKKIGVRKIKAELFKEYVMSLKKIVCKDRARRNGMK